MFLRIKQTQRSTHPKPNRQHESGFTIIELMVATTVFSVILLVVSSGIIQIGRQYFKGITNTRTQETTRAIIDEVSRSAQFAGNDFSQATAPDGKQIMCLGNTRYIFNINSQIKDANKHALWMEPKTGSCIVNPPVAYDFTADKPSPDGKELLGENMRLLQLTVTPLSSGTYAIKATVAYGDNDLLNLYEKNGVTRTATPIDQGLCRAGISGSSFCSVSGLEIIVDKR